MNTSFITVHKALFITIGVAVLFALLSLASIVFHAEHGPMQIVGKVSSVSNESVTIINARGSMTTLVPKPTAPNPLQSAALTPGTFVQAFGTRIAPGTFEVERIQLLKDPGIKP